MNGLVAYIKLPHTMSKLLSRGTSYTHQGSFVTLKDIPTFNEYGIWFFRGIGFTKYQNSLELIIQLINSSKEGFTREQLLLKYNITEKKTP